MPDFERGVTDRAPWALAVLAGCYAKIAQPERARELAERCLALQPRATVGQFVAKLPFRNPTDSEHLAECLRLAGIPG